MVMGFLQFLYFALSPKSVVPNLIAVAPSSIAISKSRLIPIDSFFKAKLLSSNLQPEFHWRFRHEIEDARVRFYEYLISEVHQRDLPL
jgi:hypothetical protein